MCGGVCTVDNICLQPYLSPSVRALRVISLDNTSASARHGNLQNIYVAAAPPPPPHRMSDRAKRRPMDRWSGFRRARNRAFSSGGTECSDTTSVGGVVMSMHDGWDRWQQDNLHLDVHSFCLYLLFVCLFALEWNCEWESRKKQVGWKACWYWQD